MESRVGISLEKIKLLWDTFEDLFHYSQNDRQILSIPVHIGHPFPIF